MSSYWIRFDSNSARAVLFGALLGFSLSVSSAQLIRYLRSGPRDKDDEDYKPTPIDLRSNEIVQGVTGLIGNTPLVRINSLSDALGVEILGKAEFLNPGGSVKDRVALRVIEDAERQGLLYPNQGSMIFEGTVGSTGISIATIGRARGYETTIIIPDDVAAEKSKALEALGANVEKVRPASFVDKKQFVNLAKRRALEFGRTEITDNVDEGVAVSSQTGPIQPSNRGASDDLGRELETRPRGFFADQFENKSNFDAHFDGTGPEVWRQTNGRVDAFVSGAGTGGTIAGTGRFLKDMNKDILVVLADPQGSGLFNKIKHGVLYASQESEGTKRRHQVDTVVEGIGINRLTHNFELALPIIDDAYRVSDAEAVSMSRYLVRHDGLFLGSSSACNLVACCRLARKIGAGKTIVTILCDSGNRHYSKFWNDEYLTQAGIPVDTSIVEALLRPLEPSLAADGSSP